MKIIGVTPAGRKRYLEILCTYLLKNRNILNEHHFWLNTRNPKDRAFMESMVERHPDFFKIVDDASVVHNPREEYESVNIHRFYKYAADHDAVYLRMDDDICWMDDNSIPRLIEFRLANPEPFLVSGNIVNNAICNHIHQRFGAYPLGQGICTYNRLCGFSWRTPLGGQVAHQAFLENRAKGTLERYYFPEWRFWEFLPFSINCISWFGRDMAAFNCQVHPDEEPFVSATKPKELNRPCTICGTALFVHFSYFHQRAFLETGTDLLAAYRVLAGVS